MKIISYDPDTIKDYSKFLNDALESTKDEKYLMFVFNQIINAAKDKEEVAKKYEELLETMNLPFAFFPYYLHFNKILPALIAKPSPRIIGKTKNGFVFDVVQEPTFGLLAVNAQMLRDNGITFDDKFKTSFYIQDLIVKCFEKNLYFSASYFIDVHSSYELFNDDFRNGYKIDVKKFNDEKQEFFKIHNKNYSELINGYVEKLKKTYGTPPPPPPENVTKVDPGVKLEVPAENKEEVKNEANG